MRVRTDEEVSMETRFVENAKQAVLDTAKELLRKGLVEGTAGNVSARMQDGNVCITPSSVDYRTMRARGPGHNQPEGRASGG